MGVYAMCAAVRRYVRSSASLWCPTRESGTSCNGSSAASAQHCTAPQQHPLSTSLPLSSIRSALHGPSALYGV
jgi:hypothetical protein